MRFYSFTNYYLSSIQIGIQTAHAVGEMSLKYQSIPGFETEPIEMFDDWVRNHKTMVLLNGGNSAELRDLWALLTDERNTQFPVSKFNEDEQSLDGALTCVAIVLPEHVYAAKWIEPGANGNDGEYWWYESPDGSGGKQIFGWEAEVAGKLRRLPLAR